MKFKFCDLQSFGQFHVSPARIDCAVVQHDAIVYID